MKSATARTTAGTPAADTVAAWMAGAEIDARPVAFVASAGDRTLRVLLDRCLWDGEIDAQARADGKLGWGYRCETEQLAFQVS